MKTSRLIEKLKEIGKNLPFDPEVVTGDDYMANQLLDVRHEPPKTYLIFEQEVEIQETDEFQVFLNQLPEELRSIVPELGDFSDKKYLDELYVVNAKVEMLASTLEAYIKGKI